MSVRSWPSYHLRNLPAIVREGIEEDAAESGDSLAEVMRRILCSHYSLECPSVESRPQRPLVIGGTATMILRVSPELFLAIKEDAGEDDTHYGSPYGRMREIIIDILAAHYSAVT